MASWIEDLEGIRRRAGESGPFAVLIRHAQSDTPQRPEERGAFSAQDRKRAEDTGRQLADSLRALNLSLATLCSGSCGACVESTSAIARGLGGASQPRQDSRIADLSLYAHNRVDAANSFNAAGRDRWYESFFLRRGPGPRGWSNDPLADARKLLQILLAGKRDTLGLFLSHNVVVGGTVGLLRGQNVEIAELPGALEGAIFWRDEQGRHWVRYRSSESQIS